MFKPGDPVWTVVQDGLRKEDNLAVAPATWTGKVSHHGRPVLKFSDGEKQAVQIDTVFQTRDGAVFFLHTLVIRHHLEGRLGKF